MNNYHEFDKLLQEASSDTWAGAAAGLGAGLALRGGDIAKMLASASKARSGGEVIGHALAIGVVLAQSAGVGAAIGFVIGYLKDNKMDKPKIDKVVKKLKEKIKKK